MFMDTFLPKTYCKDYIATAFSGQGKEKTGLKENTNFPEKKLDNHACRWFNICCFEVYFY